LEVVIAPELPGTVVEFYVEGMLYRTVSEPPFALNGGGDDDYDPTDVLERKVNSLQLRIVPYWNNVQGEEALLNFKFI
jgi:hypothetical protein